MNLCTDTVTTNRKAKLTVKIVSRDFSTNDVDSTLTSLDDIQNLGKEKIQTNILRDTNYDLALFSPGIRICVKYDKYMLT